MQFWKLRFFTQASYKFLHLLGSYGVICHIHMWTIVNSHKKCYNEVHSKQITYALPEFIESACTLCGVRTPGVSHSKYKLKPHVVSIGALSIWSKEIVSKIGKCNSHIKRPACLCFLSWMTLLPGPPFCAGISANPGEINGTYAWKWPVVYKVCRNLH